MVKNSEEKWRMKEVVLVKNNEELKKNKDDWSW